MTPASSAPNCGTPAARASRSAPASQAPPPLEATRLQQVARAGGTDNAPETPAQTRFPALAAADGPVVPGLVSVLMPVRNGREFIAAAVRSVLAQEGVNLEVIVVDDGSTDGSGDVVRGLGDARVRVVPGPKIGISAAMNVAIGAARGEFVARCDADDLFPPGRLARQTTWLGHHPEFGAVCGSFRTITARGRPVSDLNCGGESVELTEELSRGVTRTHLCTFLVRTETLRRIGGFRTWFVTAEDIDLQLRLGECCRVWYEAASSYEYRLHDVSITHTQVDVARLFYESQARVFLDQRKGGGMDDVQRGSPPAVPVGGKSAPTSTRRHVQNLMVGESWRQHRAGRKSQAILTGFRCCLARPVNLSAWRSLVVLMLKPAGPGNAAAPVGHR